MQLQTDRWASLQPSFPVSQPHAAVWVSSTGLSAWLKGFLWFDTPEMRIIGITLPFCVVVVRCVLQETTVRTRVSLNACMQRQKWSRQLTVVGASRQTNPSRRLVWHYNMTVIVGLCSLACRKFNLWCEMCVCVLRVNLWQSMWVRW